MVIIIKKENQEKVFKILEPVVKFLKEESVDCKASIFRSNYGAIKYSSITNEQFNNLHKKLLNNKECSVFCREESLGNKYILFSFIIDGKWTHALE